jgi:hypothetical protein
LHSIRLMCRRLCRPSPASPSSCLMFLQRKVSQSPHTSSIRGGPAGGRPQCHAATPCLPHPLCRAACSATITFVEQSITIWALSTEEATSSYANMVVLVLVRWIFESEIYISQCSVRCCSVSFLQRAHQYLAGRQGPLCSLHDIWGHGPSAHSCKVLANDLEKRRRRH